MLTREKMVERMLAGGTGSDGRFVVGVRTTGIYCLPSCRPARRPKPENVDFYPAPEEARAAGFRACKLCRPDDFYAGHHADEVLIEGLAAAVALDPGAFRGVGTMAAEAGVSTSTLHKLFRVHYHATPAEVLVRLRVAAARRALLHGRRQAAEIAFEVGFESLSAFNENFRKHAAMSPLQYRASPEEFVLSLPPGYPAGRVLAYLGRDPANPTERVEGRTYVAAFRLGGGGDSGGPESRAVVPVVGVEFRPGSARCRILSGERLGPDAFGRLHDRLLAALGLTIDPARFEARVSGFAELAPLIEGQRGLRVPLVADPFDGLVWAVVGQQISLPFAYKLRRRLIERVGVPVGHGLYAPSAPEAVAALEPGDLKALSFSGSKAEYLIGAARSVVDGRLALHDLAGKSAARIERTLLAVRGIEPWSAHYLMMRSFGLPDCVPVGDTGLAAGLKRFFELEERPGRDETLELMERFVPYRSLATFHLWQRRGTAA